ncbi:Presqualene diphosphate phosphatase [Trachymyrmex septentrionalis]|uniref:Presqualene diphosphate phosphatase n=2 Tax=Trachymyrmex septentrionalis TaxID=34720 RepID=A0A151K1G1_9HYME|nr:Presqualene diphosphate phosphatase [Trachymyrmex septentrionalis]
MSKKKEGGECNNERRRGGEGDEPRQGGGGKEEGRREEARERERERARYQENTEAPMHDEERHGDGDGQNRSLRVEEFMELSKLSTPGLTCFNKVISIFSILTSDKREISTTLRKALAVDAYLTDEFVKLVEKILPLRQLKVHNKLLEISCHGIPWLAVSLISIWVFNAKSLYQMQMNLLIGLLLDIIVIAVLKAVTRRRRPTTNDDPFSLGPDKYSFPSGHSSRSAFVVYFFFNLWPISLIYSPPLLAWSFSVCMSRLLMRRHYILDVIGGILLGIFEGLLIGYIYLEQETCMYLISWIADDKIPGSE